MATSLPGSQLERLRDRIAIDYDQNKLNELLRLKMDRVPANEVWVRDDFPTMVFHLLLKAEGEGWLLDLAREIVRRSATKTGMGGDCPRIRSKNEP